MFRNVIDSTPLTDASADYLFDSKIPNTGAYAGDRSFTATLRAVVFPKMEDGDFITYSFGTVRHTYGSLNDYNNRQKFDTLSWNYDAEVTGERGLIHVVSFTGRDDEDNNGWMDFLREKFTEKYTYYELVPKISDFFRKAFNVVCFIDRTHKNVAIFVSNLDLRIWHYLQAATPAFLPWYLGNGVSDEEFKLFESLKYKTPNKYLECIKQFAAAYDFRTEAIKNMLKGFESRFEKEELSREQENIRRLIENINNLNRQIGDHLRAKADKEVVCMGLEKKIAESSDDSEIMEYFLINKSLMLERVSDDYLEFAVKGYIDYYDEEIAGTMISNTHSRVYQNIACSTSDMKALLTAIFINHRWKLRSCAAYRFNLRGSVDGLGGHRFDSECDGYLPNPHIQRYSCIGNYSRIINECLVNHDYIGAIEQCAASCKSLNFADPPVMEEFGSNLSRDYADKKILEAPDGTLLTPREVVRTLAEEAAAAQEANESETDPAEVPDTVEDGAGVDDALEPPEDIEF